MAVVQDHPDVPPKDTVLVLIHPARYQQLKAAVRERARGVDDDFGDPNGRRVAAVLIDTHCARDPDLRRRLRW